MKNISKKIRYIFEYLIFKILSFYTLAFSMEKAAKIWAFILMKIGPFLKPHKIAIKNLKKIYPQLSAEELTIITSKLWQNYGYFVAEFIHGPRLSKQDLQNHIELEGEDVVEQIRNSSKPVIIFTAHLANWDFILHYAKILNLPLSVVYRKANNYFIDEEIYQARKSENIDLVAKGFTGIDNLKKAIREKRSLVMLVDQKMNTGVSVPFLGHEAMTASAIAKIALKFDFQIVPLQLIRKEKSNFKIIFHPFLKIKKTTNLDNDIRKILIDINDIIGGWINQNPSQWFWFHNRWKDKK